jgi:hypothetical protein
VVLLVLVLPTTNHAFLLHAPTTSARMTTTTSSTSSISSSSAVMIQRHTTHTRNHALDKTVLQVNRDMGVIVPEDGFGSPCVIKVRPLYDYCY